MSSRLSRCQTCSHRYDVLYLPSGAGGFPAPMPSPWLKGRKNVLLPASFVVMIHQVGIDGEVDQRALLELEDQVVRVAVVPGTASIASCTFWPVMGFFSSAVMIGMPFRQKVRSSALVNW